MRDVLCRVLDFRCHRSREVYFLAVKNLLLYFIRQWIRRDLFALYVTVLFNDTIVFFGIHPHSLGRYKVFFTQSTLQTLLS